MNSLSPSAFTSTGGRQEFSIWVALLVTKAASWCTNVRRNALSGHANPLAADVIIAVPWELQRPKSGVNAHSLSYCWKLAAADFGDWVAPNLVRYLRKFG